MKIGQFENKLVTPAVGERKTGAIAASPTPASTPTGASSGAMEASATVALSSAATQLAAGGSDGVFDAQKVQRISDAIRDGKFQVNPEAIADKLIANAHELLGNLPRR